MNFANAVNIRHPFLEGGGEMGRLMRQYDWASTPVGPVENWPSNLRTIVSTLLHTQFPMFLWWGSDMIQFYNDGYRPSLGNNGKHPSALGQRGKECWPEIWDAISPLIDNVRRTRESFFLEDQLIPIFRNGKMEDVYWTFSYSPVLDEDGVVDGVLVICTETTKKVQSVKDLVEAHSSYQQSEANLFNVFMQAPSAMAILEGPEHLFRLANEKYMQLIGKDRNILGLTLKKALPEIESTFHTLLDEVLRTGLTQTGHEVSVFLDKKGEGALEESFVNFVYQPYYKRDGEIVGVLVHAVDVSEQVLSRRKVEQSEQRLRNLISEAHVATAVYSGPEMKIEYANDAMIKVWGKDQSVIGKTLDESLPELEGQPFHKILQDVYTTGVMYWGKDDQVDLMINGKIKTGYFNFTYKPLRGMDGEIYGILNMAIDVTEQVVYRKQVERSEANLKNLILKAPVAMCLLIGPEHRIETVNDNMISLWGKPREAVMNKPVFEALPDAREQGLEAIMEGVYRTGESFSANERPIVLMRNGKLETVYQNFVYEPYRNVDGEILGVLVISIDVTNQVLARQKIEEIVADRTLQLHNANLDLQRSNDELTQFAYIASHDLQEPARKITTFADMLANSLHDQEKATKYLEKITKSSHRMLTLIRDVLTFSRVQKVRALFEPVDLNVILENIKNDFELLIEYKSAQIQADTLPVITGITVQLQQLVANLISNSLKFISVDRKPLLRIRCFVATPDEVSGFPQLNHDKKYWKIIFTDNGIGFRQEYADQIFDIFQRLHGSSEYEGTGIGLALCRKIAENHGGVIYGRSQPNEGAEFTLLLPE